MKRGNWFVLPALLAVVVPTVIAGGAGHKCTKTADECLTSRTAEIKAHGYIGVDTAKDNDGSILVKKVLPGSPAEAAGLQPGDRLVAMNGIKLGDDENEEALMAAKKDMKVGTTVNYTISRGGAERKVAMKLAPVPEDVLAMWVGHHMLEHVQTEDRKSVV